MKTTEKRHLSPTQIERLKPDTEIADEGAPGLRVRVTANGVRSFRWAVREGGKLRWITLGRFAPKPMPGFLTLREAQRALLKLKDAHQAGELARAEAELQAQLKPGHQPAGASGKTVDDMAADFWKLLDTQRKRGSSEARGIYQLHVQKLLGSVPLRDLKKSHCVAVFQQATAQRAKVIAITKQLLTHAEDLDDDFVNPAARLKAARFGVTSGIRTRWLDAEEIRALWLALEVEAHGQSDETRLERLKMGAALRLLLLTALRTSELRLAEWEHVDWKAKTLTIPIRNQKLTPKQAKAKTAKPFVVPLSTTALDLLKGLRALGPAEMPRWVLSSPETSGPYAEKTIGRFMKRLWRGRKERAQTAHPLLVGLEPAVPHDLRRTARTWLGKLGVLPHVAERCLNHSLGRIEKTYDQGDYLAERLAALELWDTQIRTFTAGPTRRTRSTP